jgi:hypothetical protein
LFAAVVGALGIAAPAGAAVTAPVQVTGPSPFAPGCAGAGNDSTGMLNEEAEVEPWVAADPKDPRNVAGAWQQDRWSDGGAHDVISGTLDGREGTFVLTHRGTVSAAGATTAGEVVPGSGSGGLEGLEGSAEIVVEDGVHRLVLDYGV